MKLMTIELIIDFFFNGISTFVGYVKAILLEKYSWYYLTHSWEEKRSPYLSQGY